MVSLSGSRRVITTVAKNPIARVLAFAGVGYLALWLIGTVGTLSATAISRQFEPSGETVSSIENFQKVDAHVWRGAAPAKEGYEELADRGFATVVDLRTGVSEKQQALPKNEGLNLIRIPIRDGQTPTKEQVTKFLQAVEKSDGPVFVHCGAGVGRTGSMSAAYLVRTGQADARSAVVRMLAIGPPSGEQIWYALNLTESSSVQPPKPVQAVSRIIDAPRRIMARF
ncbi:MAG: hypothetical protein HOQ05_06045 [Corynebacteriales bacterium]|nr:hypothetical protein [Mycobacteriales bacterium]